MWLSNDLRHCGGWLAALRMNPLTGSTPGGLAKSRRVDTTQQSVVNCQRVAQASAPEEGGRGGVGLRRSPRVACSGTSTRPSLGQGDM